MTDTAAVQGTLRPFKMLADGTLRVQIDVEPSQAQSLYAMYELQAPVAIARLQGSEKPEYGQWAKRLRLSGFFRVPDVWKALGTDAEYQEWCRQRVCAICGERDYYDAGARCEYAHVRRAGESGVGYKAEYAGIPLCHQHHQIQHQKGEAAVLESHGKVVDDSEQAKEWFDIERITLVEQWAWESLKHTLGYDSMKHVPPELIKQWSDERELTKYLPHEFKVL